MNINLKQALAITLAVLGVLTASTAQLTDLFGPAVTKTIVSVSSLLMTTLSAVMAAITGQAQTVRDVQDMPGVEKVVVNEAANKTLASMAMDPNTKIEPMPGADAAVRATAQA